MEMSLKTGFAQIFSCCPKNLSCPKLGGAAASLSPPARTPMSIPLLEYLFEEIYTWVWVHFPEHRLVIEPHSKTIWKKVQRKSKAFFFC